MIEIFDTEDSLIIRGHANDGKHKLTKEEIEACAAVTALAQGLFFSIEDITDEDPHRKLDKGTLYLDKRYLSNKLKTIVNAYCIGFGAVASGYPDLISYLQDK